MVLSALAASAAFAQPAPLLDILKQEMDRNFGILKEKSDPPPYFLSYSVVEQQLDYFSATLGTLQNQGKNNNRIFDISVRVGTNKLDNYHGSRGERPQFASPTLLPLEDIPDRDPRAPATDYRFSDGVGQVGFIASVSRPFCLNCNRLRLTSDGKLRYCLFAIEEADVKGLLRSGAPDEEIEAVIRRNVQEKWIGHEINSTKFVAPPRPMYSIGG